LSGDGGGDFVWGGKGNDYLSGNPATDDAAEDTYDGADTLNGGPGDDEAHGGYGVDTLIGGDGSDTLYGDSRGDVLNGGEGTDFLRAGPGGDHLYGTNDGAKDWFYCDDGNGDVAFPGDGDAVSWTCERIATDAKISRF
jgi:Ca2+-binding RTX toxin-like protein